MDFILSLFSHSLTHSSLLCFFFLFFALFLISLGSTTATPLLNNQGMLLHRGDRTQNHQVHIAKHQKEPCLLFLSRAPTFFTLSLSLSSTSVQSFFFSSRTFFQSFTTNGKLITPFTSIKGTDNELMNVFVMELITYNLRVLVAAGYFGSVSEGMENFAALFCL